MGSYTFLIGSYGFNLVNMVNLVRSVRLAVLAKALRKRLLAGTLMLSSWHFLTRSPRSQHTSSCHFLTCSLRSPLLCKRTGVSYWLQWGGQFARPSLWHWSIWDNLSGGTYLRIQFFQTFSLRLGFGPSGQNPTSKKMPEKIVFSSSS